jgi:hypothetical protein
MRVGGLGTDGPADACHAIAGKVVRKAAAAASRWTLCPRLAAREAKLAA